MPQPPIDLGINKFSLNPQRMKVFNQPSKWVIVFAVILFSITGCQKHLKENQEEIISSSASGNHGDHQLARNYSSGVIRDWMNMELRIIRTTAFPFGGATSRYMGYVGVALYEAVVPGMPSYQSLAGQLNGLAAVPQIIHG